MFRGSLLSAANRGAKTGGVRGDHFVVNGQKTWSSNAHLARYCLLLARTDPAASKTKGISYFILDLETPGVTLRPIKQITGASHFNEIFLDDVVIPAENLVGPENGGWQVAQSTLQRAQAPLGSAAAPAAGGSSTDP